MSKYDPLWKYLFKSGEDQILLSLRHQEDHWVMRQTIVAEVKIQFVFKLQPIVDTQLVDGIYKF